MNLPGLAIKRPVTTVMIFLSCLVTGFIASNLLKKEFFPEIQYPGIFIQIPYQGSTAEEVEDNITKPIEEVLATISDIKRMQSTSKADGATIILLFDWSENAKAKGVEAREKIDAIKNDLPSDLREILVLTGSTNDEPVLQLRISSDVHDLAEAYDLLDKKLKRPLESIAGVSKVEIYGVNKPEIMIELDVAKLISHNIDVEQLANVLQKANFSISGGDFVEQKTKYQVTPVGEFRSIEDLRNLPLGVLELRLADVAKVNYNTPPLDYGRHLNKQFAAGLSVSRENSANIVDVATAVINKIEEIKASDDFEGFNLFIMDNQAKGITSALGDILESGILGFILSIAVLYFFLRQVKLTVIVALAVPFSLLITLAAMYLLDISLNILSMMGLMLAVGMLVDNAVVVSESIYRCKQLMPHRPIETAIAGAREVGIAVTAGTITTAIVFLPNIIGEKINITVFLSHVAVTICIALIASLFIALTVIPLFLSRTSTVIGEDTESKLIDRALAGYNRALAWCLKHPKRSTWILVLSLFSVVIPASLVKKDMFPAEDSRRLQLQYYVKGSFSVDRVAELVDEVEDLIYDMKDEIDLESIYSYFQGDLAQSTLLLKDKTEATKTVEEIRKLIMAKMPKFSIAEPSFERKRSGADGKMQIYLSGDSSAALIKLAKTLVPVLKQVPGVSEARGDFEQGAPEVIVKFDRDKLSALNLQVSELARQVSMAIRGQQFRTLRNQNGETDIKMRVGGSQVQQLEMLYHLPIALDNGETIALNALADFEQVESPLSITRENRLTTVAIDIETAKLGTDQLKANIRRSLDSLSYPPGYGWSFGRSFDNEQQTAQTFMQNMLLAALMIYVVMAALFESLLLPSAVISSLIYSIVGVFWFFYLTGTTLSMMANIGILVLMGVVVNNGIVLIDHINQLRMKGLDRYEAIKQAGNDRFRPILMTAATTVLGLIPLAVGDSSIGSGGPSYYPMARAIIGGLVFSTVVSLLFLPIIYLGLDNMRIWSARVKRFSYAYAEANSD